MPRHTQWHTLVAGLWAAMGCGFAYTFSTFSSALSQQYRLSAADTSTIGIATTAVGLVTWTAGLYTDRVGPLVSILSGGALSAVGWFIYGMIAVWGIPVEEPVLLFTALGVVLTYGAACVTSAAFSILVWSFKPEEGRATAIGIAKAWVGVASGFTAMIYIGLFPSDDADPARLNYLFFLSAMVTLFVLVPLPFLHVPSTSPAAGARSDEGSLWLPSRYRFAFLTSVTLVLIVSVVLASALEESMSKGQEMGLSVLLIVIGAMPWLILLPAPASRGLPPPQPLMSSEAAPLQSSAEAWPASPWESGPWGVVKRPEAWLLWINIFALQAGGLVLNTNLGLIIRSRPDAQVQAIAVNAMFSAAQSLGRLTGGFLSNLLVGMRMPRPAYFAMLTACMAAGYGFLCLSSRVCLVIGVLLAGYAFGSMYPTMIITITELFGSRRVASNYMLYDGFPGAVAALLVAKCLATWVYQRAAGGPGKDCYGGGCFGPLYLCVVAMQLLAGACAALLACRSLPVYRCSVWKASPAGSTGAQR